MSLAPDSHLPLAHTLLYVGGVTQLVERLPSMHEALDLTPRTQEVEIGGSESQENP